MRSMKLSLSQACALVVLCGGCAPTIDTNQSIWTMSLRPEPTVNEVTGQFEMEWCPALMFDSGQDPVTFQPTQSTSTIAPHAVTASLSVENDDIYSLSPGFQNFQLWLNPQNAILQFDAGPTGAFYEKKPQEYQILPSSVVAVVPQSVNVTRRLIDGKAESETEFSLTVDYELDCGESGKITSGEQSCACDTQRLVWDVVGTGGF